MVQVANRLVEALAERVVTPDDLAEITGLPPSIIRRVCRPDSNPFLDQALLIADELGVSVGDLFWLEEASAPTSP